MPTTSEREQKGELYWDLPEDRVETVRLERGGETVELAKAGESWRLVKPDSYPADSFTASDLASGLADLKQASGETEPEGTPEDYGLAKPSAKATFVWSDPGKPERKLTRTVEFGLDIPGTDLTAARVAGTSKILFVPTTVAASVRKSADEFRSKEVFGGASLDVTGIDVARGRGRLVLAKKNGIWWLEQPIADLADRDVADRLSGDLTALRVTEFVSGPQAADRSSVGLEPPVFRVTLADAKGSKRTLDVGATRSEGDSVYAAREGQVFTIPDSLVDELSKETVAYRDKRLVGFERSDVVAIETAIGPRRHSFERKQAGWGADGRPLLASAADDVMTALSDAESKSFLEEAPAKALAARPPDSEIRIRLSSGPGWTVRFHPFRGDFAAIVSGRPGGFAVERAVVDRLREAVEKAASSPAPTALPKPTAAPTAR
jgi:hypothetical protein